MSEDPRRGQPGFHEAAVAAFVDGFLGDWDGTITVGPPITADRLYVPNPTEVTGNIIVDHPRRSDD